MSFPRKKSLNQTRTILVVSHDEQPGTSQKTFYTVPVTDEKKHLSPKDRVTSADNRQLGPKSILKGTTSENRRLSSPRAESALGHVDKKSGSLENLLTIEDLDDAFQNSAINNQAEINKSLNLSAFSIPEDYINQTKGSNKDQKSENGGLQLEEPKKPALAEPTKAFSSTNAKTQEQRDVDNSVSIEEIILPANINLTYSRYNGKKKSLEKNESNVKPGRSDTMNRKDQAKAKNKQSKKKVWVVQDEESYHIAMAGHMPQVSVTEAFSGTGDLKQSIKKENKVEILARLKKGNIYKLFNKPTKVKKFKMKEEKVKDQQIEPKKSKGIRKSIQRVIRNIRKAFISCGCF